MLHSKSHTFSFYLLVRTAASLKKCTLLHALYIANFEPLAHTSIAVHINCTQKSPKIYSTYPFIDHIHMAGIFHSYGAQGGKIKYLDKVMLFSTLQVV